MIKLLLKHIIAETAIDKLFNRLRVNFTSCDVKQFYPGQKINRMVVRREMEKGYKYIMYMGVEVVSIREVNKNRSFLTLLITEMRIYHITNGRESFSNKYRPSVPVKRAQVIHDIIEYE
jgi:hypothetical protein